MTDFTAGIITGAIILAFLRGVGYLIGIFWMTREETPPITFKKKHLEKMWKDDGQIR